MTEFICICLLTAGMLMIGTAPQAEGATTISLQPLPAPEGQYWSDLTGQPFPPAFEQQFDYARAQVQIHYTPRPPGRLTGTLEATHLKPDFCYQLKLIGLPSSLWPADSDDWANEQLGRLGRWWRARPEPAWNEPDDKYDHHHDDPDYAFEGYLLFAYFVTDHRGSARLTFTTDSSYHVIWKHSQRPPARRDGTMREFVVGHQPVRLYPEWEPGRVWPGTLRLPAGTYRVQWNLTEESFHEIWPGWARVMAARDTFEIPPASWVQPQRWLDHPRAALNLIARSLQQLWPWP